MAGRDGLNASTRRPVRGPKGRIYRESGHEYPMVNVHVGAHANSETTLCTCKVDEMRSTGSAQASRRYLVPLMP